jgi:hypothetical protein
VSFICEAPSTTPKKEEEEEEEAWIQSKFSFDVKTCQAFIARQQYTSEGKRKKKEREKK